MSLAVLCPGQGVQHPGMLRLLDGHETFDRIREETAAAVGEDVFEHVGSNGAFDNRVAQPLLCACQLATWRILREGLPAPRLYAGYSVGELACYALADALDAFTLARLARARAEAMDRAGASRAGGLLGLRGIDRTAVDAACARHRTWIAIAAGVDNFVVGGDRAALLALAEDVTTRGARAHELAVAVAAHTPLLAEAVAPFRELLEASPVTAPARPVLAGIDAHAVTTRADAIASLAAQLAQPVEWSRCLDAAYERGCRLFVELGPGRTLSAMVRERFPDTEARSVEEFQRLDAARGWIARRLA